MNLYLKRTFIGLLVLFSPFLILLISLFFNWFGKNPDLGNIDNQKTTENGDVKISSDIKLIDILIPIYRFYHKKNKDHFYTKKRNPKGDWTFQRIEFYAYPNPP